MRQFIAPGNKAIGKCSICGGLVTVPEIWGSIGPPTPTCTSCGAKAKQPDPFKDLPTIPMEGGAPPASELTKRGDHWIKVMESRKRSRTC